MHMVVDEKDWTVLFTIRRFRQQNNILFALSFRSPLNLRVRKMAHRLASHHRAFFSPKYFSGTSAHITTSSVFRRPFDVKDEDDFQSRVIQSKTPVIVDFHANWCNPCKALAPKLEAAVAEQEGKVELAKVDIDENGELAFQYGVNAVPTVLGMKNGQIVGQFQGLVDKPKIVELLEKLTK